MARNFIFREEWLEYMEPMTQKQRNNVVAAIIDYAFPQEGEEFRRNLEPIEQVVFNCIKGSIERDRSKYEQSAERNRTNGRKGGRPGKKETQNPVGFLGFSEETQNNPSEKVGFDEKTQNNPAEKVGFSQKTEKNPTNSVGFNEKPTQKTENAVGFGENPILYPISYILYPMSYILNPISYYSSFAGEEEKEEQQQQEILSYFFFNKNFKKPQQQLEKFIAFNNVADRRWASMDQDSRRSAALLWEQKPEQPPRFEEGILVQWQSIYIRMLQLQAPLAVLKAALSDKLAISGGNKYLSISCDESLKDYLEEYIDEFRPALKRLMELKQCQSLRYVCAT